MIFVDQEAESKKQEIFDLLLVAGYFRIRIPSLSDFDKILGGLSWGILCSGFDIDMDIEFSDEFKLKQKIKLSERVITCLKKMKCYHPLLPHQIQGLDYGAIYPVVQWILKFVDETRAMRQDTNQMISSEIGERLINPKRDYFDVPEREKAKLKTRNKKIRKYEIEDPIRVYSALSEIGDKIAASIYQRMSLERAGEGEGVQKGYQSPKKEDKKESDFEEQKPQATGNLALDLKAQLEARKAGTLVLKKPATQPSTAKKKQNPEDDDDEEDIEEVDIEEIDDFADQKQLKRSNSINADGFLRLIEMNKDENEDVVEMIKDIETKEETGMSATATALQQEKIIFEEQKEQLEEVVEKSTNKYEQYKEIYAEVKEEDKEAAEDLANIQQQNEELETQLQAVEKKINKRRRQLEDVEMVEIEKLIEKRAVLKDQKTQIKTRARQEKKELETQIKKYKQDLGKLEEHKGVEAINQEYEERKRIYSKKQTKMAKVSKEVALLSRKIQEYPSAIEVGQYYKRYLDLFERVQEETDNQRKLDVIYNRLLDLGKLATDQISLLRTIKKNVIECSRKKHRESLTESLRGALKQTKANLERSKEFFEKAEKENSKLKGKLDKNLGYQREYYQLLKRIQYEYERLQEAQ